MCGLSPRLVNARYDGATSTGVMGGESIGDFGKERPQCWQARAHDCTRHFNDGPYIRVHERPCLLFVSTSCYISYMGIHVRG